MTISAKYQTRYKIATHMIAQAQFLTAKEIAEALDLSRAQVFGILAAMQRSGHVERITLKDGFSTYAYKCARATPEECCVFEKPKPDDKPKRKCLCCGKEFTPWDYVKNRLCENCSKNSGDTCEGVLHPPRGRGR